MAPTRITADQLASLLPDKGLVWLTGCSAESAVFRQGLSGQNLPGLSFTGIFVPGLNRLEYVLATGAGITTFFMLPELADAARQVEFLPLCYRDISRYFAANKPDAALLMLSPPDRDGQCSFGPVTDFIADIWADVPTLIAHINPDLPATSGTPGIPYARLTAVIEQPQPLTQSDPGSDAASARIAALAATVIPDGVTLQAGIGRIPEAVLRGLTGKRDLAIHSGLIGDSTLSLLEAGALRAENPITAGVAIGSRALYDAIGRQAFRFRPPSYTHAISVIGKIPRLVTVNSAIEVDLDGLVYAEATPKGPISGPGGASDFTAGARGQDGLRIIALQSTAARGAISRIVRPGAATGPVSLGRFDTDLVITEHGIADLRLKSHAERRAALVAIAALPHRKTLAD